MTSRKYQRRLPCRVFLGCAASQKAAAARLAKKLERFVTVYNWWRSPEFPFGKPLHGSLAELALRVDLALFLISEDDILREKGRTRMVPRPNVVFELGLFAGALDVDRSLMVLRSCHRPALPSDLDGVKSLAESEAVEQVYSIAEHLVASRGLGWWLVKFQNVVDRTRHYYGAFKLVSSGRRLVLDRGSVRWGSGTLAHQMRSRWHQVSASLERNVEATSARLSMVVQVDSVKEGSGGDAEPPRRFRLVFEAQQYGNQEDFRGHYFALDHLRKFHGDVVCRQTRLLGPEAAMRAARKAFAEPLSL